MLQLTSSTIIYFILEYYIFNYIAQPIYTNRRITRDYPQTILNILLKLLKVYYYNIYYIKSKKTLDFREITKEKMRSGN